MTGGATVVMVIDRLAVAPLASATVNVTVNVPAVEKTCAGFAAEDVVPSPNVQA